MCIEAARSSRSEEHTSELQSRTLISYAVFCLKKKNNQLLDLGRPLVQAVEPRVAQIALHRQLVRDPVTAVDLNGSVVIFFFNVAPTPEIYTRVHTLSLHDALPI